MKNAKDCYEEYKNSHPSATWKLDKMYIDAFNKGAENNSILFAEWLVENAYSPTIYYGQNVWSKRNFSRDKDNRFTTQQLYQLFKSLQDATKAN